MIEFRHILCPIDFSETSTRALTYATAFATWYHAQLEILHVVSTFGSGAMPVIPDRFEDGRPYPVSHDEIIAEIGRVVAAVGAAGVHTRALAQEGRAHDVIVRQAQAQEADLLVIGTHGRSDFSRMFLGSVTEKVLHTAVCPVLTVPPAAPPATRGPVTLARILCPIDYSPSALKALQYALDLARQRAGSVTVLYALEYMNPDADLEISPFDPCHQAHVESQRRRQEFVEHAHKRLHAQFVREPAVGCTIEEVVAIDRAYKAILHHAAEIDADLIVMGAQGAGGLELMLYGSNTQHVVRAATCPVLTVRAS